MDVDVKDLSPQFRRAVLDASAADRRPGDPARLVAASARARTELGWQPRFPELKSIVGHAWAWHQAHPHGYGEGE